MKKISWPYFHTIDEDSPSSNMGSMEASGDPDRDIQMDSNVYQTLVPEAYVIEDGQEPPYEYSGGMFSPVSDDDYGDIYLVSKSSKSNKIFNNLKKGSSILDVESSHVDSESLSSYGFNVVSISQNKKRIAQSTDYELIKDDARYYNFSRKFDAFRCLKRLSNYADYEILVKNIYNHLRPKSFGVIRASGSDPNLLRLLRKSNFKVTKISKFKDGDNVLSDIFVEKDESDKVANIEIYSVAGENSCPVTGLSTAGDYVPGRFFGSSFKFSSADSLKDFEKNPFDYIKPIAKFSCDIAKTFDEKIAGLQVYPSLDSRAGLIFEYKKPQDVLYHMGTVSYAIDILFIDSSMRIKKISRDIAPGSLATFGCHNVKYVLEICGGLSDKLNIKEGSLVNIQRGNSNIINSINKFSNLYNIGNKNIIFNSKDSSFKFDDCNIISFNSFSTSLKKTGSVRRTSDMQSSVEGIRRNIRKIEIFDLDNFIFPNSSTIRFYEAKTALKDDEDVHKGFDNNSFSLKKNSSGQYSYLDINFSDIINHKISKEILSTHCILSSPEKSFKRFANISNEALKDISKASQNFNTKIVFATRASGDMDLFKDIICNKIKMSNSEANLKNCDIIQIPSGFSNEDIIRSASKKYLIKNININNFAVKSAGFPIPKEVKDAAKKSEKMLESAQKTCQSLRESFQKNLSEYEKIQANPEAIKASKGEYRLSSKRLVKKVRSMLINIRDAIRILNSIKDVSTTSEVIDALISSCSPASDSSQEIFNLIDKIDTPEFFASLQESSSNFDQSAEDLNSSIGRARDYINNNILGIVLISE